MYIAFAVGHCVAGQYADEHYADGHCALGHYAVGHYAAGHCKSRAPQNSKKSLRIVAVYCC